MITSRTSPSPTPSRGLTIPLPIFWSNQPSPIEDTPESREAQRRSELIDQALRNEKIVKVAARKKQRKVLFLGQSESGKSTLVKQFRLMQSPEAFAIERESWKSIVFLNVVRSVLRIIEFATPHFNLKNPQDPQSQGFARLRLRLTPLRSVEASILESLSSPGEIVQTRTQNFISPVRTSRSSYSPASRSNTPDLEEFDDVYAHPESRWQRMLHKCMRTNNALAGRMSTSQRSEMLLEEDSDDDPAVTLQACAADMKQIWTCYVIQDYMKEHGLFMEEQSGFFLNDIERITAKGYVPTDDDILRTRVKTIAPTETVLPNLEPGLEWRLYDVGGARRQRAKWAPFFDDMDLIIALVPVSAFDQTLGEDKTINRLRDSFELWNEICHTKALHHIPILLFLNKCDLLDKKLKAGIRLADHLLSYKGKPNETKKVLHYLNKRFDAMRKDSTAPSETPCYIHHTSVVDIETTHTVIAYVRDKIVLGQMRDSYFV